MDKNDQNNEEPLIYFFNQLLENEDEKKIIKMIFNGYNTEDIIEEFIGYTKDQNKDNYDKI
ncbi:MAG: hypothetical protein ACOCRX_08115 [Candidatus Woesearchaeota archaeon]